MVPPKLKYIGRSAISGKVPVTIIETFWLGPISLLMLSVVRLMGSSVYCLVMGDAPWSRYCTVTVLSIELGFASVMDSEKPVPVKPSEKYQVLLTLAETTATGIVNGLKPLVSLSCTVSVVVSVCGELPRVMVSLNCVEL